MNNKKMLPELIYVLFIHLKPRWISLKGTLRGEHGTKIVNTVNMEVVGLSRSLDFRIWHSLSLLSTWGMFIPNSEADSSSEQIGDGRLFFHAFSEGYGSLYGFQDVYFTPAVVQIEPDIDVVYFTGIWLPLGCLFVLWQSFSGCNVNRTQQYMSACRRKHLRSW